MPSLSLLKSLRQNLTKSRRFISARGTVGEREAAGAASERLKAQLAEIGRQDPSAKMQFSMPDPWAVRLFVALCRRYGIRPYRYPRQRHTTIMVRAPRRFFDMVVWRQFSELHSDLWHHFEATTERLISEAVHTGTSDAETVTPLGVR